MEDIARSLHSKIALEMLLLKLSTLGSLRNIDELIEMARGGRPLPEKEKDVLPPVQVEEQASQPVSVAESEVPYVKEKPAPDEGGKSWKSFVGFVRGKKRGGLVSILEMAHLVSLGDDEIVIALDNDFSMGMAKDEGETLKGLSAEYFGKEKTFKVEKLNAGGGEINSIHEDKKKRESDHSRKLKKEAMEHPRVIEALDIFKGEVKEIRTNLGFNE
jgi:hypothetical protein